MKNIILKYFLLLTTLIIVFIFYLSTIGIETDRFNDQIKNKVIQTNKNLDLDLKKIKLILDPLNLKIYAKTVGATVFFSKRPIALEYIKTQVSLSSLIKKKVISSNIEITTRSILLNDLIKFIRATDNKPEFYILEKIIKKGQIILDLNLNIDENGKIKNDYKIKGIIKNANLNILNQAKLENINLDFDLQQDNYLLNNIKFKLDEIDFISEKLNIKKISNSFLINGVVKNNESNFNINILKLLNLNFKNIQIRDIKFNSNNNFSLEIDNKLKVSNVVLNSDIIIKQLKYKKPNFIQKYFLDINDLILLRNHKLKINYKNNNLSVKGEGKIQLENEIDEIKYFINKKDKSIKANTELFLNNINLKKIDFLKFFFPELIENINLNNQKININYNDNNLSISGSGKFKIKNHFEDIEYFFEKKQNEMNFNTELNFKNTNFTIENINYKKKEENNMSLKIKGSIKDNKDININSFIINEGNNNIEIINLFLNDSNQIVKIDEANFNYHDIEDKKNNYTIKKINKSNYKIFGKTFNANSLISNLLESGDKKENNFFENNINIDLNLLEVYIDKTYFVKNLKGKVNIENNKVTDANILAFFNDRENISFSINSNDQGEKITTLFSSKAKPLVDRYKFIKGFKDDNEGFLDFYSSKKNGVSTSKLVIDNFKVKEIPALAKLLALASLQGIADLLTGEGIRFTDFEMNFTNKNKLMEIKELYAIGPAISILLEGYLEENKLISLRGTLVPATTINRSIASIPLIGDLLIGKKVGEGVFGVSFKIKGHPKKLETTVNPIKTLTPRFITRTLEKIKKN